MKPLRELHRMFAGRVSQGSLAASMAVLCVLGLVPPAMATAGGFSGLLLDRERCCPPEMARAEFASGVAGPAAGLKAGGRAIGAAPAGPRRVAGPAVGTALQISAPNASGPGQNSGGAQLAQNTTAAPGKAYDKASEQGPPASKMPPKDENIAPDSLPDGVNAFQGSTKPVGPDLTIREERELISRGWQ